MVMSLPPWASGHKHHFNLLLKMQKVEESHLNAWSGFCFHSALVPLHGGCGGLSVGGRKTPDTPLRCQRNSTGFPHWAEALLAEAVGCSGEGRWHGPCTGVAG